MSAAAAAMTPTQKRAEAARIMDILVAWAPSVHYLQLRRMVTRGISTEAALLTALRRAGGIRTDCSETVSLVCHVAGFRPPSGPRFPYPSGLGNTETMFDFLPHFFDPSQAFVGSIAVFGPGGAQHTGMVRRRGRDPLMFTHGGEDGPRYLRLSVLSQALERPTTMLSVNGLL